MTKSILKPCPFCGNDESIFIIKTETDTQYQVICDASWSGCGASSGFYDTPKETAEAWNKRIGESDTNDSMP